jgi:hypothetical protein
LSQVPYRDLPTRHLTMPEQQTISPQDRKRHLSAFQVPLTY